MTDVQTNGVQRLKAVGLGYLAAVWASALGATIAMIAFDPSTLHYFFEFTGIAALYAFVSGAPGFALTWFVSRWFGLTSWLYFLVAGALNAALALMIADGSLRFDMLAGDLGLACILGGAAGGLAFWYVARRFGVFTASR